VRRPPRRRHQQGDHQHRVQPQDQRLSGLAALILIDLFFGPS
jgi:hypothetical protein